MQCVLCDQYRSRLIDEVTFVVRIYREARVIGGAHREAELMAFVEDVANRPEINRDLIDLAVGISVKTTHTLLTALRAASELPCPVSSAQA